MSVDATTAARNAIPPTDRILVSEDEAAVLLGVSKSALRKYVRAGLIARVDLGIRRNLYQRTDLEEFAGSRRAAGHGRPAV